MEHDRSWAKPETSSMTTKGEIMSNSDTSARAQAIADALDAVETTPGIPDPQTVLKRLQEVAAPTADTSENCPKCGKPWLDHEFAVPAPYCP